MPQSQQEPLLSAGHTGAVPRVPPPWAMGGGGCPHQAKTPLWYRRCGCPKECQLESAAGMSVVEAHEAPNHALPAAGCHRYPLFFLCPNSSFI